VQAAIAAVHDEAPTAEETDWPQIDALYQVLEHLSPGPVVTLNRAVAVAMVDGPQAGLALLATLDVTSAWRTPIAWTRCGRTCSSSPGTRPLRESPTSAQRG
jgi:predicted RNA polymerase sigma factor